MTGPAIGVSTIWGMSGFESSYGTWTTPDRFLPITDDVVRRQNLIATSNGLRGGIRNMRTGALRVNVGTQGAGDTGFEVLTNGMGRLFEAIMGGAPTITAGSGGDAAAYTHIYPLGSTAGRSLSTQKQLLDSAGNHILTLSRKGCKVQKAVFSVKAPTGGGPGAGILTVKITWDVQQEVDGTSPASASYTTTHVLGFAGAGLSVAGSVVADCYDLTITITNPEDVTRRPLGNNGLKLEPVDNSYPTIEVVGTLEVLATTYYDLLASDAAVVLAATFAGGVVPGAATVLETVQFNVPEMHVVDHPTDVSGVGVIRVPVKLEGATNVAGDKANITYITSDAAA